LKNFTSLLFFLTVICFASCVNRIDIPEDDDSMLYINLEMLKGQSLFSADFNTSNNLNGSYPISSPSTAVIIIEKDNGNVDNDERVELEYNEELKKYVSDKEYNETFLSHGASYKLTAEVLDSGFDKISSVTKVPHPIIVDEVSLIDETIHIDNDGNELWEGTIGLKFTPSAKLDSRFGHLIIEGSKTLKVQIPNEDFTYVTEGDPDFFELIDVNIGSIALTDIVHRDGYFIEFDELDDNYIEIVIRSPFPITSPNQVTDFIEYDMISVSQEHFDYHIALHNIKKSDGNIFEENVLFRSNIDKGLGLFSSCVRQGGMLTFR